MAKDWTYIRITTATRDRLELIRASLRRADAMGMIELHTDDRDRVALDQVLQRLCKMREDHARRRAKASAKYRERRRAARAAQAEDNRSSLSVPPQET